MKSFYASLAVFALLLLLILCNMTFIRQASAEIEHRVDAIVEGENAAASLEELERYWQKKRPIMGLSVRGDVLLRIDEHLGKMRWAIEQQKTDELLLAVRLLKDNIAFLRKAEKVSLDNVL